VGPSQPAGRGRQHIGDDLRKIHAIGLDTNLVLSSSDHFFELGGSQSGWKTDNTWEREPEYAAYTAGEGVRHYTIRFGDDFTPTASPRVSGLAIDQIRTGTR
jgi:hypothetical protein